MTPLIKRLIMFFAGAVFVLITFWLMLWFWVDGMPDFISEVYIVGWVITGILVFGIPCVIFMCATGSVTAQDDHRVERDFDKLAEGIRGFRVSLSRRLAPPVEEPEADPRS